MAKQLDPRMIDPSKDVTYTGTYFVTPTVTNYLSTSNVLISSAIATNLTATNFTVLSTTAPTLSTDSGVTGTLKWDTDYLYVCVSTDTWKRVALSAWN